MQSIGAKEEAQGGRTEAVTGKKYETKNADLEYLIYPSHNFCHYVNFSITHTHAPSGRLSFRLAEASEAKRRL